MRPASKSDVVDADATAGDFLRRLSVADAKVLLERTRKEKDAKTMEMQKMIGVRYRDLIDSADKIVTMHSAAMRLETSLKEMPDKWKEMETTLVTTLSKSEELLTRASSDRSSIQAVTDQGAYAMSVSVHERVLFVVTAHEKLWFHLDRGESDQALALYHRAKVNYDSNEVQASIATYPFLPSMWASVHSFEQRVKAVAETCLASRGKDAQFYAGNLSAIAELDDTHEPDELVATFLRSRTRWLQLDRSSESEEDDDPVQALARRERQMRLNLRSLLLTIIHAQDIFLSTPVPSVAQQCGLRCSSQLSESTTAGRTVETIKEWFALRIEEASSHASSTINETPTIAKIAQTQAKLAAIESLHSSYRSTSLWTSVQGGNHAVAATSMFELLFGSALRKRTRDLVQHSFVDATTAIKGEIRASLSGVSESAKPVRQLPTVKFYQHFDGIHKKVEGLKSSELQRVLAEEYMRTLVGIVSFLETEYPWSLSSDGSSASAGNPSFLLCLANILVSIVSQFPGRKSTIFGDQASSSITSSPSMSEDQRVFDTYAQNNQLTQTNLQTLFKGVSKYAGVGSLFMDEDVNQLGAVGFFTFRLLSQIKVAAPFESVFVGVLQGLAQKYCEAWARVLLGQKIAPLRDFLHVEQYDLTNDEWIACHQGWSEHVILDDDMSADDDGDASEDGLSAVGEKVWLPWCETPTVSSFLFSCCYALDEAYRLVRTATGVSASHVDAMHSLIRSVLTEQLTIMSVDVYEDAVDLVVKAKQSQGRAVLNFGEFCMLQFLFDMYFVRATLGFSDFVRFGWGDEIDLATCAPSVARLKKLFERMHDFVDPVDWEIYGPQLIENVVVQFRKSRLLFSSLSEANDISEINGKPIVVSAQDTRPIVKLVEPVPRFSLLPVPTTTRRRAPSASQLASGSNGGRSSFGHGDSLFHENSAASLAPSLKLQDYLAGSNLLSAATSGTNLLSSAAKGMSFLSSATSSYLREGGTATNGTSSDLTRPKYF